MYILQHLQKKERQTHEGKTGEKTTAPEFWKLEIRLISSWQVWESSITSRQWRMQRTSLGSTAESPPRLRRAALGKERWHSGQGMGWSCLRRAGSPPPPPPTTPLCCWVTAALRLSRNLEIYFLKKVDQEAAPSTCSELSSCLVSPCALSCTCNHWAQDAGGKPLI